MNGNGTVSLFLLQEEEDTKHFAVGVFKEISHALKWQMTVASFLLLLLLLGLFGFTTAL